MLRAVGLCYSFALILSACHSKEEVSIIFGGDVMLDRGIRTQISIKGIEQFTNGISPEFKNADYTIVNLECPATVILAPLTKKFIFRAEPAWLSDLHNAGITHCIVANNHSYDQGRDGLISTDENLRKAGVKSIGYGTTQQSACEPALLRKNGIEIAIFASVTLPLESWMYLEDRPGMCQATIEDLKKAISIYKEQHPKRFIVVTLHWGVEYQTTPTMMQRHQARSLVEAGADAIIGHHPHVIQSFELINGKPVFYSLGNLIFDNPNPLTHEGLLVKLILKRNKSDIKIIPYQSVKGKPMLMDSENRNKFFLKLQKISDALPV